MAADPTRVLPTNPATIPIAGPVVVYDEGGRPVEVVSRLLALLSELLEEQKKTNELLAETLAG